MIWIFSYVSMQKKLKLFQVQTSYQLIKIQIFFHSNKNHAHNIQQTKAYYAHQAIKYNLIQDSKGQGSWSESNISRIPNVPSLLLKQYKGFVLSQINTIVSRKVLSDNSPFSSEMYIEFVLWTFSSYILPV